MMLLDANDSAPLTDLAPEQVAAAAIDAVHAHLDIVLLHLFPPTRGSSLRRLSDADRRSGRWSQIALESALGQAVCELTLFAQTGAGELAAVPGALHSVLEAAFTPAVSARRADDAAYRIDREPFPGPLGLVLRAALARYRIEVGADVTVRELAGLAGVDEETVSRGVQVSGRWVSVRAGVARTWLAARAVPGFTR